MATRMFPTLQGKVAIVTGGSRGIGKSIALELASRGANVLITYASAKAQAEEVVREMLTLGVDAIAVAAAGTDRSAPTTIVEAAVQRWAVIDIIVNNAATGGDVGLLETTEEKFEQLTIVNLRFPLFLIKAAVPHFGPAPRQVSPV